MPNAFNRRTALRIATVSLLLASVSSPIAWFYAQENAEAGVVSLALEESHDLLHLNQATVLDTAEAKLHAEQAAKTITSGLFDIAEIYSADGTKLAESVTSDGALVEELLPKHIKPNYQDASYESISISENRWILRVFVPIRNDRTNKISGYFEGVRVVPDWQKTQIFTSSLVSALLAGLASLLCGLVLYPVLTKLAADNDHKTREVLDSHISMMEALGRAIAKRDSDTGAHNYRVAWIASRIAEEMDMHGKEMQALIAGSFLHDVGKIGIPDSILLKPGKLTPDEFEVMKTHVQLGEEIVQGMGWLDGAHEVVAYHHEKWDGSGYPHRLAGTDIPLAARIFSIADVFDALSSKRPYKNELPITEVMTILDKDTGTHFDPAIMRVFRYLAPDIHCRFYDITEQEARLLLEERVRRYFYT